MAAEPTFTAVVPTVGRKTLSHALTSIARQLRPGDELIVVCNADRDNGTRARNSAMERARGTHLVFLDDDDAMVDGAFERMRDFARQHPDRVGIFREELMDGSLLWTAPEFREGNVGTAMFVVPNVEGKLAPWRGSEGNDWYFIEETVKFQGEPIFCDAVVARQRPLGTFETPLDRLRYRLRIRARARKALSRRR